MTLTLRGVILNVGATTLNVRAISGRRPVWFSENKKMRRKKKWVQVSNTAKLCVAKAQYCFILGLVPYVGWVLGIIGVILLLRGLKELANYYQDNEIYQNSLTGVKYYIIALIAAAVAITAIVIGIG